MVFFKFDPIILPGAFSFTTQFDQAHAREVQRREDMEKIIKTISLADFPIKGLKIVATWFNDVLSVRTFMPVKPKHEAHQLTTTYDPPELQYTLEYYGEIKREWVIKTVRDCIAKMLLHELDEQFTVEGVTLFDPHDDLAMRGEVR